MSFAYKLFTMFLIYHIVILLCAGFFGTFRCAVFKELLMVQQFRFWALHESAHLSGSFSIET